MMRNYTLKILSSITPGKKLEDAEIVVWVNSKVGSVVSSFRLSDLLFPLYFVNLNDIYYISRLASLQI